MTHILTSAYATPACAPTEGKPGRRVKPIIKQKSG